MTWNPTRVVPMQRTPGGTWSTAPAPAAPFDPATMTLSGRESIIADGVDGGTWQVGTITALTAERWEATAWLSFGDLSFGASNGFEAARMLRDTLIRYATNGGVVASRRHGPAPATPAPPQPADAAAPAAAPASALAALNVPAPIEDWWAACDAAGVPRTPGDLLTWARAAAYDAATVGYLADQRARDGR